MTAHPAREPARPRRRRRAARRRSPAPPAAPPAAARLAAPDPPWVHLLVTEDTGAALPAPPEGFRAWVLDGRRGETKDAFLGEVARILAFPTHFGGTWDALEDCLTDLSWRPAAGYRLVIDTADRLLAADPEAYATLVALLADVGHAWGTGATGHPGRAGLPFHTVLVARPETLAARDDWRVARLPA